MIVNPLLPKASINTERIEQYTCKTENMNAKFGKTLTAEENEVRRFLLLKTPELGRIPSISEIETKFPHFSHDKIQNILKKLHSLDIIYLNDEKGTISAAYPFAGSKTNHIVKIHDIRFQTFYAMCAIDALGVSFMFNCELTIESRCFCCKEKIMIEIKNNEITKLLPESTVVWGDMDYSCCAATSLCQNINFFASTNHFNNWKENSNLNGILLNIQEAFYLGKYFFEDRLK